VGTPRDSNRCRTGKWPSWAGKSNAFELENGDKRRFCPITGASVAGLIFLNRRKQHPRSRCGRHGRGPFRLVSTEDQNLEPQLDALRSAGCGEEFEEFASGANRSRPQLAAALARVRRGDTLIVARIDRLARSLSHLLSVVETPRAKGAHFHSLADPIDASGPSGVLVLQMLGAVADDAECAAMQTDPTGTQESPGLRRRSAPHNLQPQRGLSVRAALQSWPVAVWTEAISTCQSI
jgi:hypothetical protein